MAEKSREEIEKLYKENEKLIGFTINRYFYMHEGENEELYSAGLDGLLKAIRTFDDSKSYKFSTYAVKCIKNSILMDIRKKSAKKNQTEKYTISYNEILKSGGVTDDSINLEKTLILEDHHSFVDDVINKEEVKEVMKNFKHLTPAQQICLRCSLYYERMSKNELNEISEKLDMSTYYFVRNVFNAKRKLRLIHKSKKDCTIEEIQERARILRTEYPIVKSIEEWKEYKKQSKKTIEK